MKSALKPALLSGLVFPGLGQIYLKRYWRGLSFIILIVLGLVTIAGIAAAHVFLCFLSLLLVRIAERKTNMTWDRIRTQMERLHLGEFFSKEGRVLQATELSPEQSNILKQLKISPPQRIRHIQMTP